MMLINTSKRHNHAIILFCLLDDVNMSIICDRVHRIELQKSIKLLVAMAT